MKHITAHGLAALKELKTGLEKKEWHKPLITGFEVLLEQSCAGYATNGHEVMTRMMSPEDIEDLKNGDIPFESLKLHVKVWCEMGKPDQNR
jgi:hypothetical protein